MGLRQGTGTTGRFPGARDAAFVDRCRQFFLRQVEIQRPRLILTLGTWVPAFLAPLSVQLKAWEKVRSMISLDAVGPLVSDVRFQNTTSSCTVVALTHPSLRGPNVGRRRFRTFIGHEAEVEMLREGIGKEPFRTL